MVKKSEKEKQPCSDAQPDRMLKLFEKTNEVLPKETREALAKIHELDIEHNKLGKELHEKKIIFMANFDKMSGEERHQAYSVIRGEFQKMFAISDQKIALGQTIKEKVEDFSAEFEREEAKFIENVQFAEELARANGERTPMKKEVKEERGKEKEKEKAKKGKEKGNGKPKKEEPGEEEPEEEEEKKTPKKRGRKRKVEAEVPAASSAPEAAAGPPPKYCWCRLEKNDQMIGCENKEFCDVEWFHFSCVGIILPPAGAWYCTPDCEKMAIQRAKDEKRAMKKRK